VREGWSDQARPLLEALLINPVEAKQAMKTKGMRAHPRKEIHTLSGGDIVHVKDRQLLVLSNDAVHRFFRYGIVFACPLLGNTKDFKGSRLTRSFRGMRIAWELTQRLELECLPFERTAALEGAEPELVTNIRKFVLRFWAGTTPDGVPLDPLKEYLSLCATERRQTSGSLSIGLSGDVQVTHFKAIESRTILPPGRHFSGGVRSALPGEEVFALATGSGTLQLTINRVGSRVTATFERQSRATLQILYAHVATEDDQEISYAGQQEIRATHGLAMVFLGVAVAGESLRRTVEVGTTEGREVYEIDLHWKFGFSGRKLRP